MSSSSSVFGIGGATKSSAPFLTSLRLCSKSLMKNYNMKDICSKQSINVAFKKIINTINDIYSGNCICGVMVSVLASSAVDRGFEPWSGQSKDYIGICCFSAKHATLWIKNKDWLALNQDNVSEWGDMSIRVCCFSDLAL